MEKFTISRRDASLLVETKGLRAYCDTFHLRNLPPMKAVFTPCVIDNIQAQIFAPDPDTGVPRSDLYFALSRDTTPEIAKYIQDTLLSKIPTASKSQNADDALNFTKSKAESIEAYANRIRQFVIEATQSNQSKNE